MRWLLVLLLGCGGESSTEPDAGLAQDASKTADQNAPSDTEPTDASVDPYVTIGTGARTYEPLTAGQTVPIIEGPQGGYHVWGGFVGAGFEDRNVSIDFELYLGDRRYANAGYTEPELPVRNGRFEYAAVAVIFISNDEVAETDGETMRLDLRVTTSDGLELTDSTTVVPDCCVLPSGEPADPP